MTLIDQSLCRGCLLFCGLCGVCIGLFTLRRDDIDRPKSLQRLFAFLWFLWCLYWFICSSS